MITALSPYLIPSSQASFKACNVGDGFILKAIERLIAPLRIDHLFSPRQTPSECEQNVALHSEICILAGANQLSADFAVWPGLDADRIRNSGTRFIPFGVGIHGGPDQSGPLTSTAKDALVAIHERIEFSSWRCPVTLDYLERQIPSLKGKALMTGCPVIYDAPILESSRFIDAERKIAVTITDRDDFVERESATLGFVAERFQKADRFLVLHQDFLATERLRRDPLAVERQNIRNLATSLGFNIVIPSDAEEAINFYTSVDLHIGSRLHAHLLMLSQNKRSFLTEVDGRAPGIAHAFDFPLCDFHDFNSAFAHDFERTRVQVRQNFEAMRKFLFSIRNLSHEMK